MPSRTLEFDPVAASALLQHVQQCAGARSRLHRLHCIAESLDAFLAPRFVTTLAVTTALVLIVVALQL